MQQRLTGGEMEIYGQHMFRKLPNICSSKLSLFQDWLLQTIITGIIKLDLILIKILMIYEIFRRFGEFVLYTSYTWNYIWIQEEVLKLRDGTEDTLKFLQRGI